MSWRDPLHAMRSKGSQSARPGSLGALAQRRREHQGQFYSPVDLVRAIWAFLAPALEHAPSGRALRVVDTSCGTGAMFEGALPEQHRLFGCDVDGGAVDALSAAAQAAGFDAEFEVGSLAELEVEGMDLCLLNPPFSLSLHSPLLKPFPSTVHGIHGPNTAAISHAYAIDQALEASSVVLAILPTTFATTLTHERLAAVLRLPAGSFREENTEVDVSLAVFGAAPAPSLLRAECTLHELVALGPRLAPLLRFKPHPGHAVFRLGHVESEQVITLPVTGDARVRITRCGRRLSLQFKCGLWQARTLNALLRDRVPTLETHRYPTPRRRTLGTLPPEWYLGSGAFDLEVHLAQTDPEESLRGFIASAADTGAEVSVDPQLLDYWRRRCRRHRRAMTPMRRWVKGGVGEGAVQATARNTHLADSLDFRSARVMAGEAMTLRPESIGGQSCFVGTTARGKHYQVPEHQLRTRFDVARDNTWTLKYPGRAAAFPELAHALRQRAVRLGLDAFASWHFQLDDLIEHAMVGQDINSWVMGLGKTRLAIALCLLGLGKANVIAVDSHLVPEIVPDLEAAPLHADDWQVITRPEHLTRLKRVNVIAYARLRMPANPRQTFGEALAGRIHTAVCDEAHALKSLDAQRTRATWAIRGKRRFALTGTLLENKPVDAVEVARWVSGDGTARNPYGRLYPYLEARLIHSMAWAERGQDRFRGNHIAIEWCTREFAEENAGGAKRETPRLVNPTAFREWLAPMLKRRVTGEPDVAPYVPTHVVTRRVIEVPFDPAHFALYRHTSERFAEWYRRTHEQAMRDGKRLNLITLLARIAAVYAAANMPFRGVGDQAPYGRRTAKERMALALLREWHQAGHKTLVFASAPDLLERLASDLRAQDMEPVLYHGRIPIAKRTTALNTRFRRGPATAALVSHGAGRTGLNLWQATKVLFLTRDWSATVEAQCLARTLRPQQREPVEAVFLHHKASIDEYQAQLVAFKEDAAAVGIDDQDSELDDIEFDHLENILARFVAQLENGDTAPRRAVA